MIQALSPSSAFSEFDHQMMAKAIALAKLGRFTTSPNPNVGCVITKVVAGPEKDSAEHEIIGQGYHQRSGEGHAEVKALADVLSNNKSAEGSTCYVTLEPCSHYGRTPPCALALKQAGVARVVIAMVDPNPKVAGRGITILEEAGIQVDLGLLCSEAEALNPGFIKRMKYQQPRVTLKLASSLDARTALANGQSKWITGPDARSDVQRLRAQSCAIITGADTVLADDPSMNVRWHELGSVKHNYAEPQLRQPVRIIVDSQNRIHLGCKLFSLPGKIIVARLQATGEFEQLSEQVSELTVKASTDGKLDLGELLKQLAQLEINEVWLEAGATLAAAFLELNLVDRMYMYMAPKLMGSDALPLVAIKGLSDMQQVSEWQWQDVRKVGADLRLLLEPKQTA